MILLQRRERVANRLGVRPGHAGEVRAVALDQQLHLIDHSGIDEQAEGRAQKAQIGGRIVQQARKHPAAPIEQAPDWAGPAGPRCLAANPAPASSSRRCR